MTITDHDDLAWLKGYRMRASGQPRPQHQHDTDVPVIEGWEDLDAILKLIEQALKPAHHGHTALD